MEDAAIDIRNVSKTFMLPHEKYSSVKSLFINSFRTGGSYEIQQALKDVSFDIKKGEFFGIVGRNGSGKSTLLKMIAGIYTPTEGEIKINGSLTPFIELGVGFNPELTGRENVFLNGSLLGFSRKEMRAMYKDIVEFAELGKFMDQKLKNYSSGMQVRLAFSIAIRARSDILLLDEVLAVGDAAFQQKCLDYFVKLKKEKKTLILVSHNMQTIEQFCDRAVLIDDGKVKKIGDAIEVAGLYEEIFRREEADRIKREGGSKEDKSNSVKILGTKIVQSGKELKEISAGKDFEVHIKIESNKDLEDINLGINIKNRDRVMLLSTDTEAFDKTFKLAKGEVKNIVFKVDNLLVDNVYSVNIGIADNSDLVPKILIRYENAAEFIVSGRKSRAVVYPEVQVNVTSNRNG